MASSPSRTESFVPSNDLGAANQLVRLPPVKINRKNLGTKSVFSYRHPVPLLHPPELVTGSIKISSVTKGRKSFHGAHQPDTSTKQHPSTPIKMNNKDHPAANLLPAGNNYHVGYRVATAIHAQSKIPVYQFTTPLTTRYFGQSVDVGAPSRANRLSGMNVATQLELSAEQVKDYMKSHPTFLEDHVLEHVDRETLERWLIRRTRREALMKNDPEKVHFLEEVGRKVSLSRWKFCVHADKRRMLQALMASLANPPREPGRILWELASCIASAVMAHGFILHLVHPATGKLRVFRSCDESDESDIDSRSFYLHDDADEDQQQDRSSDNLEVIQQESVASYVAKYRHTVTIQDIRTSDPRFPAGSLCQQEGGIHILGAPVIQHDGNLTAVIELFRRLEESGDEDSVPEPFHEEDEEIVSSYLVWGGIALHYADMYHAMAKQRNLNQFLLTVVKSIFQDMISMDSLIAKVMTFAQKLVDAERASLFLVDAKAGQLYPRIFDMGGIDQVDHQIRFSVGTGIAGQVAATGRGLNIADAYSDPRFNRAVDAQTGYRTRTILCMPIFSQDQVIGVVQMVNKRRGLAFTAQDEESFEHFAVYCGLALHHARLYDRIQVSEQKYRVAIDVLSYHNCCSEEEFAALSQQLNCPSGDEKEEEALTAAITSTPIVGLDQFWFSAFTLNDLEKVNAAVYMFVDLFGLSRFDRNALIRFTLTVRKNYRRVPYHNWTHGFSVANSMYTILKRAPAAFEALEAVALFVGSLCHDLDHRGKNNKFMLETASPLAVIYTTSTMEHHHFNQTVTILQQEGHNILRKLTNSEYKEVLKNIKHCILATDLATFHSNQKRLLRIVEDGEFSWQAKEHRLLLQAIAMTGSDLCASSKPWDVQAETVKVIFQEFYEQGDAEIAAGRVPIPMMDRRRPEEQPASQVGFISAICIPCYGLLYRLIPETKPLLEGCETNLARWRELAKEVVPSSPLTRTLSLPSCMSELSLNTISSE